MSGEKLRDRRTADGRSGQEATSILRTGLSAIANLEALLDVVLFERHHSGCYLTEHGRAYLARTNRMFTEMEQGIVAPLIGPPFADDKSLKSILAKITATHVHARAWQT
ncbi:MAG TPA: hypothetical protein VK567_02275, partial [Bradyrhizobium sp.]|nr:hypothetical protein [Bradyrhizobium sp.]